LWKIVLSIINPHDDDDKRVDVTPKRIGALFPREQRADQGQRC